VFSVVNPLRNPYCSLLIMFLCKWSSNLVCITFSKIFEKDVKRDIGLWLLTSLLLPFFYKGFIIEFFILSGKTPLVITLLHI